jgi:WD40 repeat protein
VEASRLERIIPAHNPGAPITVALHPAGNQFLTAAGDGTVTTWDNMTGKELLRLNGLSAAYSPDGKRLAIVLPNRTVQLLDLATGKKISLAGQVDANLTVAFSPDGTRLATVAANNIPKVWDARTGQELVAFRGHTDLVSSAVFSPDGTRLLTASDDHTARVWDTSTGEQVLNLSGHFDRVIGAQYSPDGKWIATISGNEVYIWDAKSGERSLTLAGHQDAIYTLAFSPDSTRLATGGLDRKIIVWDVMTGKELMKLAGHTGAVRGVAFSQNGESLISSSDDGTVRFWDVRPSRELLTIPANGASGQIALNGDGTHLAATDGAGGIQIWDPFAGKKLATLANAGSNTSDIAMDRQGKRLFTAGQDGKIRIWDAVTGTLLTTIAAHIGSLNAIAVSPDGKRLATASSDYNVKIWDTSSDKISSNPLLTLGSLWAVDAVAFNADGTRFASGNQNGTIFHWDTASGEILHILRGHTDSVTAVVFSPDGRQIATASSDSTAKVWDALTGKELFTLHGNTDIVTSIAYSPDGNRIATTSRDGSAKLWDASTGEELLTFLGDGSPLHDILFSPDGKFLATGGESGVHLYLLQINDLIALAKTRVTRSLSAEECQKYLHRTQASCAPVSASPTTTPIPPTDQGRICQVTNTADLYDPSFDQMIFNGLQEAHNLYGWDAKVLQSASQQDYARNIQEFLRGDCDLIVGLVEMFDAIKTAADANPNQKFLVPDIAWDDTGENLWIQVYASDQAAFLAGYVAASVTKSDKVGVFGGIDVPPVTDSMDGFALGVDYYNHENGTKVEVLGWDPEKHAGLFVGGFCCAAEGRQITQQLLDQGADVILPVAGDATGAGALYAVKTHRDAYLIGVDTDWALSEPEYADIILTSVLKNLDVSEVQTVKAIVDGTFRGGNHFGTLKTGEVGLAPFHELDSLISPEVKVDLEQIKQDIIAGKIETK